MSDEESKKWKKSKKVTHYQRLKLYSQSRSKLSSPKYVTKERIKRAWLIRYTHKYPLWSIEDAPIKSRQRIKRNILDTFGVVINNSKTV